MLPNKQKVLLTGSRSLFTLDLARRLAEVGHQVFTAETSHFHVCRFSNATKCNFITPSPRFHSKEFINKLVDIVKKEQISWIIPSFEEIFCLSKGVDQFPKKCTIFCSSYAVLHSLHNKWTFNQKISSHGFDTPQSYLVSSSDELKNIPFKVPFILKPVYSRASLRIYKVDINDPLPSLVMNPANPWVAQEWIKGKKYCSYSIAHEGLLSAHSVYPIHFSIDESSGLNFKAIEHPKIFDWVKAFVKKEHFTGQIAFDFIEKEDGRLYAIECNPRGTSGIHLFHKKDRLDSAFFNPPKKIIQPKLGASKQIAFGMLLYGWKKKNFKLFLKELFTNVDIIFSFKDLRPFFFQLVLFFVYILRSLKFRKRLPHMFNLDIEWNGEEFFMHNKNKSSRS